MRFFRTPVVTSRFADASDQCWRGCGLVGDHTHIFWDCPKLLKYRLNVQIEIKKCLNVDLPLKPSCFVLGILPDDLENHNQRILLRVIIIAKKMITISWLRPQPPTVTQWREKVKDVYYMENIITRLHLKTDVFLNRWSPITSYFID